MTAAAARPVTAVVVTYQSEKTLDDLFAATRRCHDEGLLDCIVVDNASRDATAARLLRESAWARVVLEPRNHGFARACNLGAAGVTTPYTLFLNPDASIEPQALRTLLAFMEAHPHVGIAGPATLCGEAGAEPVLQPAGPLPTPGAMLRDALPGAATRAGRLRPIVPGSAPQRTGWVCGAVFLVRSDLLRRLSGFDPRFFMYWEEMDLCRRALALGFETWTVGAAVARHIAGASSAHDRHRIAGCIARHYYQSRRYYMIKHHGWLASTAAELAEFALLCARAAGDRLRGRAWDRILPRMQAQLLSQPD